MEPKKKPVWNQNSIIRGAIRRVFSRSPVVIEVKMKVRREVPRILKDGSRGKKDCVQYQCNQCKQYVGSTKCEVDHLNPVVEVNEVGFVDWNTFVERLFCDAKGLQVLCDNCHDKKTLQERRSRQALKDSVLLDKLEEELKGTWTLEGEKELKKRVNKFLSKTKADSTRERALKLKQIIINKIEKED